MIKKKESEVHEQEEAKTVAVELVGLQKLFRLRWQWGKQVVALEGLDLKVMQGEVFGLLGPNGSGKSTTMKLLLGLLKPTAGEIKVFGQPAGSMLAKKRIGFLPESPYFPNFLTGSELLRYFGQLSGMGGALLRKRIQELLELVELEYAAKRIVKNYSKGMLQRIGLAQALLHDPDLLLLDEPTAGVDPIGSRRIRDLILKLKGQGKTIIFSSHLLEQVEDVSDRVVILERGRKLSEGTMQQMLEQSTEYQISFKGLEQKGLEKVLGLLKEQGAVEINVSRPRQKLETFFMNLVNKEKDS